MQVIAISGSPVKGGNTERTLEAVLAGARERGAVTDLVRLYNLDFDPCDGCDGCASGGGCVHDDDATTLMERMAGADAVVFGTPVYWYHVSGVLKNLIDRTYATFFSKTLAGKPIAAVMVQHSSGAEEADILFRRWCRDQEATLVETVTVSTEGRRGVVAGDEELLQRFRNLGARLID